MSLKTKGKEVGVIQTVRADVTGVDDATNRMVAAAIRNKSTPSAPTFQALSATPIGQANFVDYASGGCDLDDVVAIGFTGPNGDPL